MSALISKWCYPKLHGFATAAAVLKTSFEQLEQKLYDFGLDGNDDNYDIILDLFEALEIYFLKNNNSTFFIPQFDKQYTPSFLIDKEVFIAWSQGFIEAKNCFASPTQKNIPMIKRINTFASGYGHPNQLVCLLKAISMTSTQSQGNTIPYAKKHSPKNGNHQQATF